MYSSLLKVDIAADTPTGPLFVQTDHRSASEMNEEPEMTILFGLTRVLNARKCAASETKPVTVLYTCADQPTPQLVQALASAGADLEVAGGKRTTLKPVNVTPAELADKAFAALAKRVQGRTGISDMAGVLAAVEAETLADGLDAEEDEISYWRRVMELAAVTGEILRARHGGHWMHIEERSDIPFGFARPAKGDGESSMISLPTNRAARFIADGEAESMFYLLESDAEANTSRMDGPVLPSLRKRADALREKMLFKPLLERADDQDVPVIAYGSDGERTFGIITTEHGRDLQELHDAALINIAKQEVKVDRIDIADVDVVVVNDSFFATEKLLDRAFMRKLHRDLGAEMLAVATPCRGLMFVTNAAPSDPMRSMTLLRLMIEKESQTTRSIAPAILLVRDGEVVGQVKLSSDDAPIEPPPPKKKPGFFRRLFGGGQA